MSDMEAAPVQYTRDTVAYVHGRLELCAAVSDHAKGAVGAEDAKEAKPLWSSVCLAGIDSSTISGNGTSSSDAAVTAALAALGASDTQRDATAYQAIADVACRRFGFQGAVPRSDMRPVYATSPGVMPPAESDTPVAQYDIQACLRAAGAGSAGNVTGALQDCWVAAAAAAVGNAGSSNSSSSVLAVSKPGASGLGAKCQAHKGDLGEWGTGIPGT